MKRFKVGTLVALKGDLETSSLADGVYMVHTTDFDCGMGLEYGLEGYISTINGLPSYHWARADQLSKPTKAQREEYVACLFE